MPNYIDREEVICPHCDYRYDDEDMDTATVDLWSLAPNEDDGYINCVMCKMEFVVRGGYTPLYSTAFCSEELDY